ncbi:hypothetical protein NL676_031660 [Syzygium grande]|nr:hypothetical protein NL676_031660 [Syzygium grande]
MEGKRRIRKLDNSRAATINIAEGRRLARFKVTPNSTGVGPPRRFASLAVPPEEKHRFPPSHPTLAHVAVLLVPSDRRWGRCVED